MDCYLPPKAERASRRLGVDHTLNDTVRKPRSFGCPAWTTVTTPPPNMIDLGILGRCDCCPFEPELSWVPGRWSGDWMYGYISNM